MASTKGRGPSGGRGGARGPNVRGAAGGAGAGGSGRGLTVRVKSSRGRTVGQTLWLQRQLNDPYVARAKAEGLRSRAAYKLVELNERYKLLRKGMRVVDLGAAPGGWSRVAAPLVGTTADKPLIVGIDVLEMDNID